MHKASEHFQSTKTFRSKQRFHSGSMVILAQNELKAVRNNKPLLVSAFLTPLLYLIFFMAGLRGMTGNVITKSGMEIDFLTFTLPGILMLLVISLMSHTVYRSTIDKRWGLLGFKFMNGISPLAYVSGLIVYPLFIFTLQGLLLLGMSLLYGLNYSVHGVVLAFLMGFISIIFWCCIGIIITTRINNYHQRDMILSVMTLPIMFTAPTFYAIESAPNYIQMISWFNPVTYQVTATRSLFIGDADGVMIGITLLLTMVAVILAVRLVAKAELVSNEH